MATSFCLGQLISYIEGAGGYRVRFSLKMGSVMKVGILTFHRGTNHGAYLQTWYLCNAIRKLGHNVNVIDYRNAVQRRYERFRPWVYRRPSSLYAAWIKHRIFQESILKLPLTPYAEKKMNVEWASFDVVVVGSDVVWDCMSARLGRDSMYFGDFGKVFRGPIIAYGPSCGDMHWRSAVPEWVGPGLRGFSDLSVRDQNTRDFIYQHIGREAEIVVDPTWLNFDSSSQGQVGRPSERERIMFVYADAVRPRTIKILREYCRVQRLASVAAGYPQRWCDYNRLALSPFEWERLLSRASIVITSTFHGTIYSLREGIPFVTISNPILKLRVETPLECLGESSRLVDDDDFELDERNLIVSPTRKEHWIRRIREISSESIDFLRDALER